MIAILTAMARESRSVRAGMREASHIRLGAFHAARGNLGSMPVALMVSGVGRENTLRATKGLLEGLSPSLVLSWGFAGALEPGLRTGDLLAYRKVALEGDTDGRSPIASSPDLLAALAFSANRASLSLREVDGVTTLAPVTSAREKAQLRELTGAAATDMESYWAALAASQAKVPFAAVRAVIDTANQDLPGMINTLAAMGPVRQALMAPLLALLRPWAIPGLVRLARQARIAERSLAQIAQSLAAEAALEGVSTAQ